MSPGRGTKGSVGSGEVKSPHPSPSKETDAVPSGGSKAKSPSAKTILAPESSTMKRIVSGRELDVDHHRHAARAHRAEQGDEVFEAVDRADRHPVAPPEPARREPCRHRAAGAVERAMAQGPGPVGVVQIDDGRVVASGVSREDAAQIAGPRHGSMIIFPITSRSRSRRTPSRVSSSGRTQSITGSSLPSWISSISRVRSSGAQLFEPSTLSSKVQM